MVHGDAWGSSGPHTCATTVARAPREAILKPLEGSGRESSPWRSRHKGGSAESSALNHPHPRSYLQLDDQGLWGFWVLK